MIGIRRLVKVSKVTIVMNNKEKVTLIFGIKVTLYATVIGVFGSIVPYICEFVIQVT